MRGGGDGEKRFFHEAGLGDFEGFGGEDLGERCGVAGEVKPAVAAFGQFAQKRSVLVGLAAQGNDGGGNPGGGKGGGQFEGGAAAAGAIVHVAGVFFLSVSGVGEQDEVFDPGRGVPEDLSGFCEGGVDVDPAAAGGYGEDFLFSWAFGGVLLERGNGVGAGIDGEHAEVVAGLENTEGKGGALVGECHFGLAADRGGHRAGPVQNQEEGDRRDVLAVFMFHADGKHLFDGGPEIAADAEAVFATEHQEPAPELLDPAPVEFHGFVADGERGDIAEDEEVKRLQFLQRSGQTERGAGLHPDFFPLQRLCEGLGPGLVAFDEEHRGFTPEAGDALGAVVFGPGIGLRLKLDLEKAEATLGLKVFGMELLKARLELDSPGLDQKLVLVEFDPCLGGAVGVEGCGKVEGFAGFDPARRVHGLDQGFRVIGVQEGHRVDLDTIGGQGLGGGQRLWLGLVSIGEQDNPAVESFREKGVRKAECTSDVGGSGFGRREWVRDLGPQQARFGGRMQECRLSGEPDHADPVPGTERGSGLGNVRLGLCGGLGRDAGRLIQGENEGRVFGIPDPAGAGEAEEQECEEGEAEQESESTLCGRKGGEGFSE